MVIKPTKWELIRTNDEFIAEIFPSLIMYERSNPHVLITGATDGIGKQTALELLELGANVIIHGRSADKLFDTKKEFQDLLGIKEIETVRGDFASLNSVRAMADDLLARVNHIDILINNVGTYENARRITVDGFELTFQVNYLAPFLLTNRLLPLLLNAAPSRIVNVASRVHAKDLDFDNLQGEKNFSGYVAYATSKLCLIMFTVELAEMLRNCNVSVNCLHPGVINTKLLRKGFSSIGNSVEEGAKRVLYLAQDQRVGNITGQYFMESQPAARPSIVENLLIRSKLWGISQQLSEESFRAKCEQEQNTRLINTLYNSPKIQIRKIELPTFPVSPY